MKIFIGADHRGIDLKRTVFEFLQKNGHEIVDVGTHERGVDCDYPQFSLKVATHVAQEANSRGILLCMTGIGHSIAANKIPGAYAALCYNQEAAVLSRQHNNSNILVVGTKFIGEADLLPMIEVWLRTSFEGGRHERRFEQIKEIEKKFLKS